MCNLNDPKSIFFLAVKSETNCASDSFVETTKTTLPCLPAFDQSVTELNFCANSVPFRIRLSLIPRKSLSAKFARMDIKIWRIG